jgi:hypothetical protein
MKELAPLKSFSIILDVVSAPMAFEKNYPLIVQRKAPKPKINLGQTD